MTASSFFDDMECSRRAVGSAAGRLRLKNPEASAVKREAQEK